ncbi:MAG: hypothetical protein ACREJD_00005 [Phycisphaerales bacterium]
MAKNKTASDMTLGELEAALQGAKEKLAGMEQELADFRKSIQSYVSEFGKRQRQFEKDFGMMSSAPRNAGGSTSVGGGRRAGRGTVADGILAVLGKANKPVSVDDVVKATGASSKPSIAQTIMKLVQAGKVHRYNAEGKVIPQKDKSQRARGYAIA